jgi:hypothetical protein
LQAFFSLTWTSRKTSLIEVFFERQAIIAIRYPPIEAVAQFFAAVQS